MNIFEDLAKDHPYTVEQVTTVIEMCQYDMFLAKEILDVASRLGHKDPTYMAVHMMELNVNRP